MMTIQTRLRLSFKQKAIILSECEKRKIAGGSNNLILICNWAKTTFKLNKRPCTRTIRRILADSEFVKEMNDGVNNKRKKILTLTDAKIENDLNEWVCEMWENRVHLSDALIQEKARRLFKKSKSNEILCSRYGTKFSNGWLHGFKKRNMYRRFRTHGESADADIAAAERARPYIRALISQYGVQNTFNTDEFAFYYRRAPRTTVGPAALPGRKLSKHRLSVLICCNADGTERVQPLVIGRSARPKCFGGKDGSDIGFDYVANERAWMNKEIFFSWLLRFNNAIASNPERQVLLLMDNATCHGQHDDLPVLSNVRVFFLPPRTTSVIQPLDAGIIAAI